MANSDNPRLNPPGDHGLGDCTAKGHAMSEGTRRIPRIAELDKLQAGWDSYAADPPSPLALGVADGIVFSPCSDGGVQLLICASGTEVQIGIGPGGHVADLWMERICPTGLGAALRGDGDGE